ncbi:MAG: heat shock protein Hsp20 [Gemmatimonadetes bacterium]|nr:heat shock protein Hsp20 [Gemmatimonadota bacterium]
MYNRSLTSTLDRMLTLNRALDEAFQAPGSHGSAARLWVPAMDVTEHGDAYVISAELAGVPRDAIELDFERNVLTIRGTKPNTLNAEAGEMRVFTNERVSGSFERSLRLPESVDAERISAAHADGVLTVTVPKAQGARARRIEISSEPLKVSSQG